MRVDLFDFDLPQERIALRPVRPRDAARMLVVRGGESAFEDRGVRDLPDLLEPGDVLVFNDTRVIPAQLEGRRAGGEARIGATLHKRLDLRRWQAFVRNAKRVKDGDQIVFVSRRASHGDLWIVDPSSRKTRRLTRDVMVRMPYWYATPNAEIAGSRR